VSASTEGVQGIVTHFGLAEQGKLHALAGEHDRALLYYRHAMRMAVGEGAPEAFFRHYLECTIESLELMESFEDVLDYCRRADDHYKGVVTTDEHQIAFIARDRVAIAQRRGLVLAKLERRGEAIDWLAETRRRASLAKMDVPLIAVLDEWLRRGLHVSTERIVAEQRRLCYFAVTPDSVDPSRAVSLPEALLTPGAA